MLNDRLGHPAGDRALELLGEALAADVRRIDRVGRMGGEEFALILPETGEHEGYVLAERLRGKIRENFAADLFPLTISFGVASYPTHGATTAALLKAADQALYTAKEFGQDCSVIYSAETAEILRGDSHRKESTTERRVASLIGLASSMDTAEHSQMVGRYTKLIAVELGLSKELHRARPPRRDPARHRQDRRGRRDREQARAADPRGVGGDAETSGVRREDAGARGAVGHRRLGPRPSRAAGRQGGDPLGLHGDQIPLEARIVAMLADAYEAMTTDRVYRPSMPTPRRERSSAAGSGSQFDPRVVAAFLKAHEPNQDATWRIVSGRAVAA